MGGWFWLYLVSSTSYG